MAIIGTRPRVRLTDSGSSTPPAERNPLHALEQRPAAAPTCFVCRKNSRQVKFVITDPANKSNVCEHCADECVRVFVCTCVC